MIVDDSEIAEVRNFIRLLNSKKNSIVVVEGKRDENALKRLGFSGRVCQFHSFKGLTKFVDSMPRYRHLIVLLDSDRKGRYLTRRIISQLEHRMTIDLSFKRKLVAITKGKVRNVENLSSYVD
ncbi:MAG: topoisomerase [Thaumarchaeota archaeon 13_1_40CM_38_12]|nr:MAG: topoisomerase [Thaumarchaeota archaeon 13_1_40CM_38_12]OLC34057.1 MAG: topoisomerase [Thaumarchaeota archaeon 13_1_40CM_4_38_7]OLC93186.1 MAG: topoisomerase [Thaumarchaeota archaeon 13_1_40CM_3_38_6]OLD41694.1 MAG: topoisomerase [Thaumarchaeota archaeon 13_1_40CM_2_39_4]TLY03214.1 MAG: topoisomerase [Nitrososphaerota archaeon]